VEEEGSVSEHLEGRLRAVLPWLSLLYGPIAANVVARQVGRLVLAAAVFVAMKPLPVLAATVGMGRWCHEAGSC
jgi:hypothetical protein